MDDDPDFDPNAPLPTLNLDDGGGLAVHLNSQLSGKTSSQLSPLTGKEHSPASGTLLIGGFDDPRSSSIASYQLAEPFHGASLSNGKEHNKRMMFDEDADELNVFEDWGIQIDADGNVVEPELPTLLAEPRSIANKAHHLTDDEQRALDEDGDVIMNMGDERLPEAELLPDAEAFPTGQAPIENAHDADYATAAPARRRRQQPRLGPDNETKISRAELRAWGTNYLANAEQARKVTQVVTTAQAKRNAYNLLFGLGVGGIGMPVGIPDVGLPLAELYAGDGLQMQILGDILVHIMSPRVRRRKASEAVELGDEAEERRVRPRMGSEDAQVVQKVDEIGGDFFPADQEMEIGRNVGEELPDLPSDVPWIRQSSLVPGSSQQGSATKIGSQAGRQTSASPLHDRGSNFPAIERFSDQDFGYDGFAPLLHSGHNNISDDPVDAGGLTSLNLTSQAVQDALDNEGRYFLGFLESKAEDIGVARDDDSRTLWVGFEDVFDTGDKTRQVMALGFYQLLSLATKGVISVEQDDQDMEPFGTIRAGVKLSSTKEGLVGPTEST